LERGTSSRKFTSKAVEGKKRSKKWKGKRSPCDEPRPYRGISGGKKGGLKDISRKKKKKVGPCGGGKTTNCIGRRIGGGLGNRRERTKKEKKTERKMEYGATELRGERRSDIRQWGGGGGASQLTEGWIGLHQHESEKTKGQMSGKKKTTQQKSLPHRDSRRRPSRGLPESLMDEVNIQKEKTKHQQKKSGKKKERGKTRPKKSPLNPSFPGEMVSEKERITGE